MEKEYPFHFFLPRLSSHAFFFLLSHHLKNSLSFSLHNKASPVCERVLIESVDKYSAAKCVFLILQVMASVFLAENYTPPITYPNILVRQPWTVVMKEISLTARSTQLSNPDVSQKICGKINSSRSPQANYEQSVASDLLNKKYTFL